jgi:hypothetical protein
MIAELAVLRANYPKWFESLLDRVPENARGMVEAMADGAPSDELLFRVARGRAPEPGESTALTKQELDDVGQFFLATLPVVRQIFDNITRIALHEWFIANEVMESRLKEAFDEDREFFQPRPDILGVALSDKELLELLNALHDEGILTRSLTPIHRTEEYKVRWFLSRGASEKLFQNLTPVQPIGQR